MMNMKRQARRPLPTDRLERIVRVLRVLTHVDRLRICDALLRRDQSVGELAEALELKQNVVSQHLNVLRAHEIVAPTREGRQVYYRVVHPGAQWLLDCVCRHADG
jgi:DNA-binding transcriptional ArsR family regulator